MGRCNVNEEQKKKAQKEAMEKGSVSSASAKAVTVNVGDKEFTIHELRMEDMAAAEQHILNQRLDTLLEQTRTVSHAHMPDNVRSKAIAEVLSNPVSFDEVLSTVTGQLYLLYRSIRRGDSKLGYSEFLNGLENVSIAFLSQIMFDISGLEREEKKEVGEIPLEVKTFGGAQVVEDRGG